MSRGKMEKGGNMLLFRSEMSMSVKSTLFMELMMLQCFRKFRIYETSWVFHTVSSSWLVDCKCSNQFAPGLICGWGMTDPKSLLTLMTHDDTTLHISHGNELKGQ